MVESLKGVESDSLTNIHTDHLALSIKDASEIEGTG